MFIILFQIGLIQVYGMDFCEDIMQPIDIPCQMMTPAITCSNYNYIILNDTELVENDTLFHISNNIYVFNFTINYTGNFLVKLCDNSTREIIIGEDGGKDDMLTAIILSFLAGMGILVFLGYIFFKEDSWIFYLSYGCWYLALLFPLFALRIMANADGISDVIKGLLETTYIIYLYAYLFLFIFLFIYFLHIIFTWGAFWSKVPNWKKRKLKEGNY